MVVLKILLIIQASKNTVIKKMNEEYVTKQQIPLRDVYSSWMQAGLHKAADAWLRILRTKDSLTYQELKFLDSLEKLTLKEKNTPTNKINIHDHSSIVKAVANYCCHGFTASGSFLLGPIPSADSG